MMKDFSIPHSALQTRILRKLQLSSENVWFLHQIYNKKYTYFFPITILRIVFNFTLRFMDLKVGKQMLYQKKKKKSYSCAKVPESTFGTMSISNKKTRWLYAELCNFRHFLFMKTVLFPFQSNLTQKSFQPIRRLYSLKSLRTCEIP